VPPALVVVFHPASDELSRLRQVAQIVLSQRLTRRAVIPLQGSVRLRVVRASCCGAPLLHPPSIPSIIPDPSTTSRTSALGYVTTSVHDRAGRQVASINAEGEITTSTYYPDGMTETVQNPRGFVTSFLYDKANRQVTHENPEGEATNTTYYPDGQVETVTDPEGKTTAYTYDKANRETSVTNAAGESTLTEYYPDGELKRSTNPEGHVTSFVYDAEATFLHRWEVAGDDSPAD
jgi:YD repeat-containing protein